MTSSNAQPVVWGNYISPCSTPGVSQNSTSPVGGRLWGSNVRRFMGIAQIMCGVIELGFGIAVVCVQTGYYDVMDYIAWGIWTGVFAIVTGLLGVYSPSSKCMVISYMVCSIICAVLSGGCCIYAGFGAAVSSSYHWYYNPANTPLYVLMCITFFAQMVISIIGASFTCGALSGVISQSQQVARTAHMVYYTPRQMPQTNVPAPPYTMNATQSAAGYQATVQSPTTTDALAKHI